MYVRKLQCNIKKSSFWVNTLTVNSHRECFTIKKPKNKSIRNLRQNIIMFYFTCCVTCGIWWKICHFSQTQGWWQWLYIVRLEEQTLVSCKCNDGCHRWLLLRVLLSLAIWDTLQHVEFKIQMSCINHWPFEFSVYLSEPPGSSPWCIIKTNTYGITPSITFNLKKISWKFLVSRKEDGAGEKCGAHLTMESPLY